MSMKTFLSVLFLFGSAWALDLAMLDGANSQRIAWEAKRQAHLFNQQFQRLSRKLN
jgi:hypothetical protein